MVFASSNFDKRKETAFWPLIKTLEGEIKETPWWKIFKKMRLTRRLEQAKDSCFSYGISLALRELEESGILKRNNR